MRNLDVINPSFLRPSKFTSVNAGATLALVLMCVPLAYGAAPDIPLAENLIIVFMGVILSASMVLAMISAIFKWGWKAQYYGASLLCVACISFMAIVPCLAVLLYGSTPYWVRLSVIFVYGASHYSWCRKFAVLYKNIYEDPILRGVIFEEESDAVYYLRRGDDFLLEKYLKFSQTPKDGYFVLFIALAFLMIPMMGALRKLTGVPFVHIFLIVAMLPVSWLSIGLAFRGYLIFYLYPARIKKATGKEVYVDLASKHRPLEKRRSRSEVAR